MKEKIKAANLAFQKKDYSLAIDLYREITRSVQGPLSEQASFNLRLAESRLNNQRHKRPSTPPVVSVSDNNCKPSLTQKEQAEIVSKSELFDPAWYTAEYRDVAKNGADPLDHFIRKAVVEKRDPGPWFSSSWYLKAYPDVEDSGLNPLVHFLSIGTSKGYVTRPSPSKHYWWDRFVPTLNGKQNGLPFLQVKAALDKLTRKTITPSVVIPVFNAASEFSECLKSVIKYTPRNVQIIVVDDASTDPRIKEIVEQYKKDVRLEVIFNSVNLGFTRSINKGIEAAGKADVILLNSDTRVASGWITRLVIAAYLRDKIGSVTPLSNNAGAFSAPNVGEKNPLNEKSDYEALARAVAQNSLREYPEAPTGNGFCMYVRRDCITQVGLFDAEAFPRGYGEENDFCCRATAKGWTHVVDDSTYIYHKRSASFGEEKEELVKNNRLIVDERFPDYTKKARSFVKSDSMNRVRSRVADILAAVGDNKQEIKPRVLYVLPSLSPKGGTPQTNQDLMQGLSEDFETYLLRSNRQTITLYSFREGEYSILDAHTLKAPIKPFPHCSDEYDAVVASWLMQYAIELVHIRHIAWHGLGLIDISAALNIPVIFSFHDYYTLCPTVKLLDEHQKYCAGSCTDTSGDCRPELWESREFEKLKHHGVNEWRKLMVEPLKKVSAFVTTSPTVVQLIHKHFPALTNIPFHVIQHGRDFTDLARLAGPLKENQPIKVVIPGTIGYPKGASLLREIAPKAKEKNVQLHVLGTITHGPTPDGVIVHGAYNRQDFSKHIREIKPHLGAVLSIWPETYCHTLTELWAAGIPVIGLDFGAVGERIRQTNGGWLLDNSTASSFFKVTDRVRVDPSDYYEKLSCVSAWQQNEARFQNCAHMAGKYREVYNRTVGLETEENAADTTGKDSLRFITRPPAFASNFELGLASVLVPVHNALDDVKKCIKSLVENTYPVIELIILNDGSDQATKQWLDEIARQHQYITLLHNETAQGYTQAVNILAEKAVGDFLVVLNSDTIVPPFWLERLLAPMLEDSSVAATGPVSNAATWQSVPHVRDVRGGWKINDLDHDISVPDYDRFVQQQARGLKPSHVKLLNGFCYAVRTQVFRDIGGLDKLGFPHGYGEENDFFMKLQASGHKLTVVPNLFVFHAKSKSFGSERRKLLSQQGNQVLYDRYGKETIGQAAKSLAENAELNTLRERCNRYKHHILHAENLSLTIVFILPASPGGGGVHSVVQETQGLRALGHQAKILVPRKNAKAFENFYPALWEDEGFLFFETSQDIVAGIRDFNVIIGTHFLSIRLLKEHEQELGGKLVGYYVQDYEPWILPPNDQRTLFQEAVASYSEIEGAVLFAKTRWICSMIWERHGIKVNKIAPSIDRDIYYPKGERTLKENKFCIAAMVRPATGMCQSF